MLLPLYHIFLLCVVNLSKKTDLNFKSPGRGKFSVPGEGMYFSCHSFNPSLDWNVISFLKIETIFFITIQFFKSMRNLFFSLLFLIILKICQKCVKTVSNTNIDKCLFRYNRKGLFFWIFMFIYVRSWMCLFSENLNNIKIFTLVCLLKKILLKE